MQTHLQAGYQLLTLLQNSVFRLQGHGTSSLEVQWAKFPDFQVMSAFFSCSSPLHIILISLKAEPPDQQVEYASQYVTTKKVTIQISRLSGL